MNTIIIYMTNHGATEKNVTVLKKKLNDETIELCNLKTQNCELSKFDNVIIGGSIHAGQLQGKVKKFCKKNESELLTKKLGIFITCMEESDKNLDFLNNNYPKSLLDHAKITGIFGGEFNFDKMNFLEKFIVKKITGFTSSQSHFDESKIAKFAEKFME